LRGSSGRLVQTTCTPSKHKLKDYGMMKNFMILGSLN
jgi:hypothetical protein